MSDLLNSLHDSIYDATGKNLQDVDLIAIATMIPDSIMNIGDEWGYYDTEFRERVFAWAKHLQTIEAN